MTVDILLRTTSIAVLLLLLHQLFWSRGGSRRHNVAGGVTMSIGALLVALVAIRGSQQEQMSATYAVHLLTGGPFFVGLFTTGVLGWRAKAHRRIAPSHRWTARATLALLCLTLAAGVASMISSH